jgi:hypothetical protein
MVPPNGHFIMGPIWQDAISLPAMYSGTLPFENRKICWNIVQAATLCQSLQEA